MTLAARLALTNTAFANRLEGSPGRRMLKAVDGVRDEFTRELSIIRDRARAGTDKDELDRAIRDTLIAIALLLLIRGLNDGGVDYETLDADERADVDLIMAAWLAGQIAHVSGFAEALDKLDETPKPAVTTTPDGAGTGTSGSGGNAPTPPTGASESASETRTEAERRIDERVAWWVGSGVVLYNLAYASAQSDKQGTWKVDPNKEHCEPPTDAGRVLCTWLDGQRHRLSWFVRRGFIPQEPGSATLQCGGWHCGCGVYDDWGVRIL